MGRHYDWLMENWCYRCDTAHSESCSEYQQKSHQRELEYQERHKEKLKEINDIGDLITYLNDDKSSIFRTNDKAEEVLSILYRLLWIYDKRHKD